MKNYAKLSLVIIVAFVGMAWAASRGNVFVTKTSRNDGNTITPFYVSCSSTAWTTLLAASPTRRVAKFGTIASADIVCLSTAVAGVDTCSATQPGFRLQASLPYEHASEALMACRALDTKTAVTVTGLDYTDSGDSGDITN